MLAGSDTSARQTTISEAPPPQGTVPPTGYLHTMPRSILFFGYLWCVVVSLVGHLENGLSDDNTCLQINMHWLLSCCLRYLSVPDHTNPSQSYLKTAFTLMFASPQSMTQCVSPGSSPLAAVVVSPSGSSPLSANPYA